MSFEPGRCFSVAQGQAGQFGEIENRQINFTAHFRRDFCLIKVQVGLAHLAAGDNAIGLPLQSSFIEPSHQGMQKLKDEPPDLVTLDVMMPKESGIKMYRDIKTNPEYENIPVLIISGLAKKTFLHSQKVLDKFKGQQVPPPDGYIEKPPEPEELMSEVKRLLG